jgi:hypothetical protein
MINPTESIHDIWKVFPPRISETMTPSEVFNAIGSCLYAATEPQFIVLLWKELCANAGVDPLSIDRDRHVTSLDGYSREVSEIPAQDLSTGMNDDERRHRSADPPDAVWDELSNVMEDRMAIGLDHLDGYLTANRNDGLIFSRACQFVVEVTHYNLPDKSSDLYELVCGFRMELIDKINVIIDRLHSEGSQIRPGMTKHNKLIWKASTNVFVHVFNTLASKGYFDLPMTGGKQGEMNNAEFARILLHAFDVNGLDPEGLRRRLAGAGRTLAEHKAERFQMPSPNELVIPLATEMDQ